MMRAPRPQRGAALVTAIFLLVVLAALGAYMVTLSGVQTVTASQGLQAARAYFGARAGLDWAIHRAVGPAAGSGLCDAAASFAPTGAGLTGVSVAVTCSSRVYTQFFTFNIYHLTSSATYGTAGTPDYAERKLEATVCRSTSGSTIQC